MAGAKVFCYSTAKCFGQGAYLMMTNDARFKLPNDTSLILPFHHLIGFSVELYLKSLLLHVGLAEKHLRKHPYGHDLDALHNQARKMGYDANGASFLCERLAQHKSFEYRYIQQSSVYHPASPEIIFDCMKQLDGYVDQIIGASHSKGVAVGDGWTFPAAYKNWRL